jgi:predicted secreted hydrolase
MNVRAGPDPLAALAAAPPCGAGLCRHGPRGRRLCPAPSRGAFDFPADHGAHPDFRIEWWYLTATLTGPDGTDYGAQWTLFRTALAPGEGEGWASPQLWMGHAAVTTPELHLYAERLARGGVGQAGVAWQGAPFSAWIDDWQMLARAPGRGPALSALDLTATGAEFRLCPGAGGRGADRGCRARGAIR